MKRSPSEIVKRRTWLTAWETRAFEIGIVEESSMEGITLDAGGGTAADVPGLSARIPEVGAQELLIRMGGNGNNMARVMRSPYLRGEFASYP